MNCVRVCVFHVTCQKKSFVFNLVSAFDLFELFFSVCCSFFKIKCVQNNLSVCQSLLRSIQSNVFVSVSVACQKKIKVSYVNEFIVCSMRVSIKQSSTILYLKNCCIHHQIYFHRHRILNFRLTINHKLFYKVIINIYSPYQVCTHQNSHQVYQHFSILISNSLHHVFHLQ